MPDICEIVQVRVCMEANAHEPLELPGEDGTEVPLTRNGVNFGFMLACRRCGLMYWEPAPPPLVVGAEDAP